MKTIIKSTIYLSSLFLLLSCSSETEEDLPNLNSLPQWELTQELEITDSDEFLFNQLGILQMSNNGEVFAHDFAENHLLHFDQQGQFLGSIGRAGSGPGEFQSISSFYLNGPNQLHIFDRQNMRFTAYNRSGDQWTIGETVSLDENAMNFGTFRPIDEPGTYLATSAIVFRQEMLDAEPLQYVSLTDRKGVSLRDSVAVLPFNFFLLNETSGGGFSVRSKPNNLGLRAHFNLLDEETVIAARSDRFEIDLLNIHTGENSRITYPFSPVSLTDADRRLALDNSGQNFRSVMRESMPDHHNLIHSIFPDNQERIWINMQTLYNGEEIFGWMIVDKEGEFLGRTEIPDNFTIRTIQGDRILGLYSPEDDVPSIRVYRVKES
ncbi:MAG: 6-bladed beta-propeller [Balneolaceae bacterium]|nr:6-bladed beta-propeller [Balneolaceae bacterium]MCH8547610.1 6-bladed beta-propeller [Balneolaceae bacterium]